MEFRVVNTEQRRSERMSFTKDVVKDPGPPKSADGYFQEQYRLEGRIACTFWANSAQLRQATERAEKVLLRHLYREALDVLTDMELAVAEMDEEELRKACLDMRDLFTGANR